MCFQVIKLVHIVGKTDNSVEIFKGLESREIQNALKLNPTQSIRGSKYIEYFTPRYDSIVYLRLLEEDISEDNFKNLKSLMINTNTEDTEDSDLVLYKELIQ